VRCPSAYNKDEHFSLAGGSRSWPKSRIIAIEALDANEANGGRFSLGKPSGLGSNFWQDAVGKVD